MTGVYALGIAPTPRHNPNSLFRSGRIAGGIWHLAGHVLAFAAHIGNRIAVRRKIYPRQFLPVIPVVLRKLPRRESRSFSNPNIPPAFLIEGPSDAITLFGGCQIRRERRA